MLMNPGATNRSVASISAAACAGQIADARDETVHDADVGTIAWQARPVYHGPVTDDDVVRRRLLRGEDEHADRERENSHTSARVNTGGSLPSRSVNP